MTHGRVDLPSELAVWSPHQRVRRGGDPNAPRVALVHLGNAGGLGTTRRVAVWQELLAATDARTFEVNLLGDHRRLLPSPSSIWPSLRGEVVLESAAWSRATAEQTVQSIEPDVVVFVTPRAFHPRLAELAPRAILDFQDLFSASYRNRAAVDRRPGAKMAWRALAWAMARFERREHSAAVVTAGWSEAASIGATWIPNTVAAVPDSAITDRCDAEFDLLFFGKLSALPNVDAMRTLAGIWPRLTEEIPDVSCLVAGSDLTAEIRDLASAQGWVVEEDFAAFAPLCSRARIAVAPLRYASGIQNKVLEAAAAGLPQIVAPQALGGTAPGFPAMVVRTREGMVTAVRILLAEPRRRLTLATEAHRHVVANYSAERWAPVVRSLLRGSSPRSAAQPNEREIASVKRSAPSWSASAPIDT